MHGGNGLGKYGFMMKTMTMTTTIQRNLTGLPTCLLWVYGIRSQLGGQRSTQNTILSASSSSSLSANISSPYLIHLITTLHLCRPISSTSSSVKASDSFCTPPWDTIRCGLFFLPRALCEHLY